MDCRSTFILHNPLTFYMLHKVLLFTTVSMSQPTHQPILPSSQVVYDVEFILIRRITIISLHVVTSDSADFVTRMAMVRYSTYHRALPDTIPT